MSVALKYEFAEITSLSIQDCDFDWTTLWIQVDCWNVHVAARSFSMMSSLCVRNSHPRPFSL